MAAASSSADALAGTDWGGSSFTHGGESSLSTFTGRLPGVDRTPVYARKRLPCSRVWRMVWAAPCRQERQRAPARPPRAWRWDDATETSSISLTRHQSPRPKSGTGACEPPFEGQQFPPCRSWSGIVFRGPVRGPEMRWHGLAQACQFGEMLAWPP